MTVGDKGLFWKEEILLSEAKEILTSIAEEDKVDKQKYAELASAYEILLKQTSKLTRLSDADEKRLNNLLSRLSRYVSPPLYKKITSENYCWFFLTQ